MKKLSETYKELGIAFSFPVVIKDENGGSTYYEHSRGDWNRFEYDSNGNMTYFERSDGYWERREYDSKGNRTYYEYSNGDKEGTPRSAIDDKSFQAGYNKAIELMEKKLKEL
jgi:hypothetical protein